ncbi:efflux RND transporter periplasmic adaptor subunit [Akkermansiaceae bacterium]|nr:efflux RND transporter periplasmic adaptor subunit [Akkermansiaceae bacterium]MDB4537072.1 efflux RND transporter periplasmic adaptor subunit [Akkermansiaceae bacterium]
MSLDDLTKQTSTDRLPSATTPKRKRSLAWLLPVGLLLGFVLILTLLFGERLIPATEVDTAPVITVRAGESAQQEPPSSPSESLTPPTGKGGLLFQASGWVEPDPYTVYSSTLINGVVSKVEVLEGEAVKKGDLLATLIDDDAKLDLQEAKQKHQSMEKRIVAHCAGLEIVAAEISAAHLKVESLETVLEEAQDNYSRISQLSEGSVSKQQLVQARLATERQIAMLAKARAEIPRLKAQRTQIEAERDTMRAALSELSTAQERAQLNLDRTRIKAPMDGIVLQLHAAPGKKRMLNMDDPLSAVIVELYDPNQLQARIDVPLNEAAALSAGQSVELISELLPDRTFEGTVTRISGQADLQRNTLQAKVSIKSPDFRLRPDMLVRAKFFALSNRKNSENTDNSAGLTSSGRLSIYVPENALVSDSKVWVVSPDNTAESRTVTLGTETRDGHRLVIEGLRSGESVILPPHADLEDGTRITTSNTH